MNDLVAEYRQMPWGTDHLPDAGLNGRKCEIIRELDTEIGAPEVARLLLDVLSDQREFDLARVEAIRIVGIYLHASNPLAEELSRVVLRIANHPDEDEMVRGWADRYVARMQQVWPRSGG